MKTIVVAAVSILVVAGVLIYEEGRIADLRAEVAQLKKEPAKSGERVAKRSVNSSPRSLAGSGAAGERKGARSGSVAAVDPDAPGGGKKDDDWAETFRKMIDNPVGAAMMKEESKGRALRMYGGFIDTLGLKKDEKEYFLGLVAGGVGEEDRVGMKLFGAKSDEERIAILDQMEADEAARRESIREFLNNDEDYARYEHFEDRKDIYEQLPGLRAAMNETGGPLQAEQEEQLVEAIFQASVQSGLQEDWDGRAGMEQMGEPGATQRFKDQWSEMQNVLAPEVGTILETPEQQEAFREHQTQVGNMVVFGLQFVEGMIANQQKAAE